MIRSLAALALVLASALPASAQQAAPAPDELLALNFYMQQQDTKSVDAELRRLQLKYPEWTPPQDLSRIGVTVPSTEIDTFYRHVAEGRFEHVIDDQQASKQPAKVRRLVAIRSASGGRGPGRWLSATSRAMDPKT